MSHLILLGQGLGVITGHATASSSIQPKKQSKKYPSPSGRGTQSLKVPHNAVLPQFLTWINPGGNLGLGLKFPGTRPVYCHRYITIPTFKKHRS